jgi:hypothetical protein
MDAIYFSIGGFVFAIAIFKRELLIQRGAVKIIFGVSVGLFIAGVILHFTGEGRDSTCGALLSPLLSLGLFRLCRRVFLKRYQREPNDSWLDWSEGMGADRVFNIVYFVTALWLWMVITIGMLELGKAGW